MISRDWNSGSLDGRQLTLRWRYPTAFSDWRTDEWRFAPRYMLSLRAWWNVLRHGEWQFWLRRSTESTHRCYCNTGSLFDGTIVFAGFGVMWFYSHFRGEIPCPCDIVCAEMEQENL